MAKRMARRTTAALLAFAAIGASTPARAEPASLEQARADPAYAAEAMKTVVGVFDLPQVATYTPYYDSAGLVVRHSTDAIVPFRLPDQANGSERPHFSQERYDASLKKFPSVRDCLEADERTERQPDLTRINWQAISTHENAYVCYSRIFTSYHSVADVEAWLKVNGFRVSSDVYLFPEHQKSLGKFVRTIGAGRARPYDIEIHGGGDFWETFFLSRYVVSLRFTKADGLMDILIDARRFN